MPYRKLVSASAIVIGLGLLTNIVSFIKELIVVSYFGIGDTIDVFAMGFGLPLFFSTLLGSAIGTAVVPSYVMAKNKKNDSEFITEVTWLLGLILVFIVFLCFLVVYFILPLMMSGFSDTKKNLSLSVAFLLSPMIFLQGMSSFLDSIYNVNERFTVNALVSMTIPIGTVVMLLLYSSHLNVWVLCYGVYLGYFVKVGIQVLLLKSKLFLFKFNVGNLLKKYNTLIVDSFYIASSSVILGVLPLIGQSYAASLDAGAVSTLNYANKLAGIALMIVVGAVNAVVFPFLSKKVISHGMVISAHTGSRIALSVLLMGFLCAVPIFYVLEPVVRVLFERGAFDKEHTVQVSSLLKFYLLYIPFYVSGIILARVVVSIGKSNFFIYGNIISLVLYYFSCSFFVKKFGLYGLAIALAIVYFSSFLYLYLIVYCVKVKKVAI